MKTVQKSVLIWYSPQEMFDLVTSVQQYPQFLPWCDHTRVLEQDDSGMLAEVGIALSGIRHSFVTRNLHEPGRRVQMQWVEGPVAGGDGDWHFHTVGDGSQRAARVELLLNYGFDSVTLSKVVGPVFDRIAASFVDAFVRRADELHL